MHALSLLALLLPLVAANTHKQCGCRTYTADHGWETNTDLAHWVCNKFFRPTALWDRTAQRCAAREDTDDYLIDGQIWENQCIYYGTQAGYYPLNALGYPTSSKALKVDIALGQCFN
ncbi:hypothetical protein E4U48_003242 [Claviceps purpurea]|nr:hypothetical protein E4U48_003242 [Claviceps purpurea]